MFYIFYDVKLSVGSCTPCRQVCRKIKSGCLMKVCVTEMLHYQIDLAPTVYRISLLSFAIFPNMTCHIQIITNHIESSGSVGLKCVALLSVVWLHLWPHTVQQWCHSVGILITAWLILEADTILTFESLKNMTTIDQAIFVYIF